MDVFQSDWGRQLGNYFYVTISCAGINRLRGYYDYHWPTAVEGELEIDGDQVFFTYRRTL